MKQEIIDRKWQLYQSKRRRMLMTGLKDGRVRPYDEKLIVRLREIYYGSLPLSIILLSDGLSNGYCYDRAQLLAQAFLDDEDIQMVYAAVDFLRLNPKYATEEPYWDHCVVERTTKDGRTLIYDTAYGLVFDKDFYWKLERPRVRKVNSKGAILDFLAQNERCRVSTKPDDSFWAHLTLSLIKPSLDNPNEMYAKKSVEWLQREIALFQEKIDYGNVERQVHTAMAQLEQEEKFFIKFINSQKTTGTKKGS